MIKKINLIIAVILVLFLSSCVQIKNIKNEYNNNNDDNNDKVFGKNNELGNEFIENDESSLYAEYSINKGEIVDNDVVEEDKIVWENIKNIIPNEYLNMISRYEIITDGLDGILASVNLNEDNKTWTISVDINDTVDENQNLRSDSIITLIHEMSHIIALNNKQMCVDNCDEDLYTVQEGTLKKDAYLNLFYDKFWKNHMDEHSKNSEEDNTDIYNKNSFYNKYKDEFISDYAATNPVEDFSESFAYFVVNDKPNEDDIKSQKLLFFYNWDEFINIRDDIRKNIDINVNN